MVEPLNKTNPIDKLWKVERQIGRGGYGTVFEARNIETGVLYAVKSEEPQWNSPLSTEIRVYEKLTDIPLQAKCFPKIYYDGYHHGHKVIVMELLGPSLWALQDRHKGKIPVPMTLKIGKHAFKILEQLHYKGIVHNDIKPNNLVLGREGTPDAGNVFMIDFGMATFFRDAKGAHLPSRFAKQVFSTTLFGARAAHKRRVLSRRDDIESMIYNLVFLAKGSLPWSEFVQQCSTPRYADVIGIKDSVVPEELFSGLPRQFLLLWTYFKTLEFREVPNYQFMRSLFTSALDDLGIEDDGIVS